jgi:uncharacterized protein YcbK (DUF882 family)
MRSSTHSNTGRNVLDAADNGVQNGKVVKEKFRKDEGFGFYPAAKFVTVDPCEQRNYHFLGLA